MGKQSGTGIGVVLKNLRRVAPHPWIGLPLVRLELEKRFFNLLHPGDGSVAGKIRQASFRITDLCNLRCHTCGQWGDSGYLQNESPKELRNKEVPAARYLELLKDLREHGHRPLLYFWGGEPMLYNGILDVIAGASELNLPTSIATNGTRVAESAQRLVDASLFLLQVSIDGHNAELHNRIRPHAGGGDNFADIVRGLDAVRAARRRLPVIAALTVVSQANLPHLTDIYDAFRDKVDLFVFYLSWWIDEANAAAHEADFERRFGFRPVKHRGWIGGWKLTDTAALERQIEQLDARSRPWPAPPVSFIPRLRGADKLRAYYTDHAELFGYRRCVSIHHAVEVNSNGDVSPCRDYHDYVVGNIKTATLTELWNAPAYQKFRHSLRRDGLMPVCRRCCGLMGY